MSGGGPENRDIRPTPSGPWGRDQFLEKREPDWSPSPGTTEPASNASPRLGDANGGRVGSHGLMSSIETQARRPHHLTLAERASAGRGARAKVPRSVHGEWQPAPDRADAIGLLEEQGASRVQELVPLRYGRMLVDPFTFYRGSAYLMAADLASVPRTDLTVQLCGDAHLSNFGSFAAPDRRLVFDLNDFDETLPGPFEWDVKRMVASFAVAGRDREFDDAERRAVNAAAASSYREAMQELAQMGKLDVWYARLDVDELDALLSSQFTAKQVKRFRKNMAKARSTNSLKAFSKLVEIVDGRPRLINDPPMIARIQELMQDKEFHEVEDTLHAILHIYRRTLQGDHRHLLEGFRFTDAARKVVGVGSVGTRS